MSYFEAEQKIPVQQQSVGIPSENGLSYNSNQIIEINVPPTTKFFNPKESYLQFFVTLKLPAGELPTRLQLDAETGAQCLIKDIRIYDGNRNALLEEITDYNTMVAMKYDYETNQSLRNKRALAEGATIQTPDGRGTRGTTETQLNQHRDNPYYKPRTTDPDVTTFDDDSFVKCKVCLPLHTGIFQNDKIFPLLLTSGIHISITLESDARVMRCLDSVAKFRRTPLNPIFHSYNGCRTNGAAEDGETYTTWYVYNENNQWSADSLPFVVGESFGFYDITTGTAGGVHSPVISRIEWDTTTTPDMVKITTDATEVNIGGDDISTDGKWSLVSKSIPDSTSYNATYLIENVELVLQQVAVDPRYEQGMLTKMKEGGTITYDFLSVTNYKYSQLASDRVANIRIPLNNQKARSIVAIPTDATVYTAKQNLDSTSTYSVTPNDDRDALGRSCRSGLVGISDNITSYNFLYDGRLQPSRLVNLSKTSSKKSISQQALIENDKGLTSAGINTHSMRNFSNNFIISRALSLGSGVYDARNKDFSLQVNYQETAAPAFPKLWKIYCYHIRRLNIKGETISVDV
tara:strand:+ start:119 stop:1843 length:1725 start_codon:yes stop_codon:yes gene_type:complete